MSKFVVQGCFGVPVLAASIEDVIQDAIYVAIEMTAEQGYTCQVLFPFNGVTVVVDPFTPVQALADAYRAARDGETIGPRVPRPVADG